MVEWSTPQVQLLGALFDQTEIARSAANGQPTDEYTGIVQQAINSLIAKNDNQEEVKKKKATPAEIRARVKQMTKPKVD